MRVLTKINHTAFLCCLLIGLITCIDSTAQSQVVLNHGPAEDEDATLRSMFTHGLSKSAQAYVRSRQALDKNRANIVWWTAREMECHARWALQDSATAEAHWQACDKIAEAYQEQLAGNNTQNDSRWPWIQWQLGRCRLLRAQSLLATYLAAPTNTLPREKSLELVREILKRMDDLSKDLKRRQALASRQATQQIDATVDQLNTLDADAQQLQCEALMVRWQLYPVGSDDRAAALAEVKTTAVEFLRTRQDANGRAALQLALAISEMETGDQAALITLEQLASQSSQPQVRVLAASHVARTLALQGQESRARTALAVVEQIASTDASLAPLFGLSQIEVAVAVLDKLPAQKREKEMGQLVQLARNMGQMYGDYWRTRAEALLVGKLSSASVTDAKLANDLLLAEVRQLVAKDDPDSFRQAAKKLLAGSQAQSEGARGEVAIDLAVKAAAILRKLKDFDQAVETIETIAMKFSKADTAAAAHLSAIEAHVEKLKASIQDAAVRARYVALLRQQMIVWPDAEPTEKAKAWLFHWCIGQKQPKQYVAALGDAIRSCTDTELIDRWLVEFCEQSMLLPAQDRWTLIADWLQPNPDCKQNSADSGAVSFAGSVTPQQLQLAAMSVVILSDLSTSNFIRPNSDRTKNLQQFQSVRKASSGASFESFVSCVSDLANLQQAILPTEPKGWNQLSELSRAVYAPALVDALDALDNTARSQALPKLNLSSEWAKVDVNRLNVAQRAALARVQLWIGDKAAADRLVQLANENKRDGQVQLIFCYHLRAIGELESAKKIATQVAGLSPAGDPMQLAARWCLMRLQLESDEKGEAVKAAKFTLATQSSLTALWQTRFQRIAESPL